MNFEPSKMSPTKAIIAAIKRVRRMYGPPSHAFRLVSGRELNTVFETNRFPEDHIFRFKNGTWDDITEVENESQ